MIRRFTFLSLAAAASLLLSSCGKDDVLGKQADQRALVGPELQARWVSSCQSNTVHTVTFTADRVTFEKVEYLDPDCQLKDQTTRHAGKYFLANNYKEGLNNSVVFQADNDVLATFHTDYAVDTQNNILTRISNEKEQEIPVNGSPQQKADAQRATERLRSAKQLVSWKRDEEKSVNRLQLEKLRTYSAGIEAVAEQASTTGFTYEVDNGFLQLGGPSGFSMVYKKN